MPCGTIAALSPRRIQDPTEVASTNYGFDSPTSSPTRGKEKNILLHPPTSGQLPETQGKWRQSNDVRSLAIV